MIRWRRAGDGGGEFLYQLSKGIYSRPCVSTGRLSEDDQRIHGGRQRATWDQPVPTDAVTSHDIFGLAQNLSLVVDEIVAR
jgi:hypothetical protein